jgi:hypothetical protein
VDESEEINASSAIRPASVEVAAILEQLQVPKDTAAGAVTSEEPAADSFLALVRDPAACKAFVARLFPDGVPRDQSFFVRLEELRHHVSFTPSGDEALGLIWSEAMRELSLEDRQAQLRSFTRQASHAVFEYLSSLWVVIRDHAFPASFLAEWFVDLVRAVEHDIVQDGAWTAIRTACRHHVDIGLEVLRLLPTPPDGQRLNIAGFMLGVMRTSGLEGDHDRMFREAETFFRDHADGRCRAVFNWSWVTTARDRVLTPEELDSVLARADRSQEDLSNIICVACRLLTTAKDASGDIRQRCRQWIGHRLSPSTSREAKHYVARAAQAISYSTNDGGADLEVAGWILAIQPVSPDDMGTWSVIGNFLCGTLPKNRERFIDTFQRLCTTGAATIHRLMHERKLQRLHRSMHKANVETLVGQFCVSADTDTRRLGLYLFDSLEMAELPQAALAATDIGSRLLFYESQRATLSPKSIARILVAVAPFAERATDGFREEVVDELKLQAHNFAGECRTELGARGKAIPMVTKALEEVASYLTDLDRAHKAGINAMEVTGHRRAVVEQQRRFSRLVARSAETESTILKMMKKTKLLYGRTTSMFLGGQVLGDPMPLVHSSVSMEIPIIDYCDPEEMAMRRFHASAAIEKLLQRIPNDKTFQEPAHE